MCILLGTSYLHPVPQAQIQFGLTKVTHQTRSGNKNLFMKPGAGLNRAACLLACAHTDIMRACNHRCSVIPNSLSASS